MGLFSSITQSFKKSKKLRELELLIHPPNESSGDLVDDLFSGGNKYEKKAQALEEFLDFCDSDPNVGELLLSYGIGKNDLKEIYKLLIANGGGQWCKGHFVALSTIAYSEPLRFFIESERSGANIKSIIICLLDYWDGKIKQEELMNYCK